MTSGGSPIDAIQRTTIDGTNYDGLYHMVTFPFYVEMLSVKFSFDSNAKYVPTRMSILASNNDGVSFVHIGGYQSGVTGVTTYTVAVNSTKKFKTFKLVYEEYPVEINISSIRFSQIQFYGDIFT